MLRRLVSSGIELKTPDQIALMREAGKVVAESLQLARSLAVAGNTTLDIEKAVDATFTKYSAESLFRGYLGPGTVPFPAVTCISINEQVVHGIPNPRVKIRDGDLVKIDTACRLNGWCADAAITVPIGEVRAERLRMLKVAQETLQIAINELPRKKWWSEVAILMQKHVEDAGFGIVRQYVGHGIGRTLHETPQVPNFYSKDRKQFQDFRLEPGLVLAVEPMVTMGRGDVTVLDDHWTVVTRNGMVSVHVEHTLALTDSGLEVLTSDKHLTANPTAEKNV
jgi:methionyl aminopeptidase